MLGVAVRTFRHADQAGASRVQYVPKVGSPYFVDAVFDKAHVSIDQDTGAPISSTDPIIGIQLSQMQAEPKKGDRVVVDGTTYTVADYQPDGVAGARLPLHQL
jgi:hypothetical protein